MSIPGQTLTADQIRYHLPDCLQYLSHSSDQNRRLNRSCPAPKNCRIVPAHRWPLLPAGQPPLLSFSCVVFVYEALFAALGGITIGWAYGPFRYLEVREKATSVFAGFLAVRVGHPDDAGGKPGYDLH